MANASTRIESRAGQRARLVLQAGHSQVALPPGAHVQKLAVPCSKLPLHASGEKKARVRVRDSGLYGMCRRGPDCCRRISLEKEKKIKRAAARLLQFKSQLRSRGDCGPCPCMLASMWCGVLPYYCWLVNTKTPSHSQFN